MASRSPLTRRQAQAGFSMVEVLTAMMVLAIVAGGLAAGLTQASRMLGHSKADSIADKLALSEMEKVRRLGYDEVGVVNGNPPGVLVADRVVTRDGADFRVQESVSYVDNPAPGASQTRIDYKQVRVIVTPQAGGNAPISQTSLVAPPEYASIAGRAAIVLTAKDGITGAGIPGAAVTITGGASPATNDVTDSAGGLVVPGLLPSTTLTYTTAVSKSGYVVTNPASEFSTKLSAGQTFPINAVLVKPVRVEVNLLRGTTAVPIPEGATVTLTSPTGASSTLTGTGVFGFDTVGGSPVLPSTSASWTLTAVTDCLASYSGTVRVNPAGYPTTLTDVESVNGFTRGTLNVTVVSNATGLAVPGAVVTVTGGDANLAGTVARRTTDAAGKATFCVPATTTKPYSVKATAAVLLTTTATVNTLPSEGTVAVPIRMGP